MTVGTIENFLLENGNIKFGKFKLASGKESDYYVDIKSALLNPNSLQYLGKLQHPNKF